ncbi:MAG TPA: hypothetical protein VF175_08240 [Lacipirellula sp.]
MLFAQRVFWIAGIYGLVVLLPQYFMEGRLGRDFPPPVNHPEHFYGFIGVATAWQVAFLIISRDPVRYRLIMLPGILEKLSFGVAAVVLFGQGRLARTVLAFGVLDLLWAVLFAWAFIKVGRQSPTAA